MWIYSLLSSLLAVKLLTLKGAFKRALETYFNSLAKVQVVKEGRASMDEVLFEELLEWFATTIIPKDGGMHGRSTLRRAAGVVRDNYHPKRWRYAWTKYSSKSCWSGSRQLSQKIPKELLEWFATTIIPKDGGMHVLLIDGHHNSGRQTCCSSLQAARRENIIIVRFPSRCARVYVRPR